MKERETRDFVRVTPPNRNKRGSLAAGRSRAEHDVHWLPWLCSRHPPRQLAPRRLHWESRRKTSTSSLKSSQRCVRNTCTDHPLCLDQQQAKIQGDFRRCTRSSRRLCPRPPHASRCMRRSPIATRALLLLAASSAVAELGRAYVEPDATCGYDFFSCLVAFLSLLPSLQPTNTSVGRAPSVHSLAACPHPPRVTHFRTGVGNRPEPIL